MVRTMPRRLFIHCPDAAVFDISGIDDWTEEELEIYVRELRKHWREKTRPNLATTLVAFCNRQPLSLNESEK
jgi:hypothetical protein